MHGTALTGNGWRVNMRSLMTADRMLPFADGRRPRPQKRSSEIQTLLTTKAPTPQRLVVAGLFAGIGGIEVGLSRVGHESNLLCEIDPGALAVLRRSVPHRKLTEDVRDLRSLPRDTQLLAGGFPCQDLSQAGKTQGIEGASSGLVGHIFRLLERKRVPLVLLENVPFMLQLEKGAGMNLLVTEFERLGYQWAYRVVDSRSFGLPQRRQRVIFLAARELDPRSVLFADEAGEPETRTYRRRPACGFYWTEGTRGLGWAENAIPTLKGGSAIGIPSPPAIWMPSGGIAKPDLRDAERLQGFNVDWTKPAEEAKRPSFRWTLVGNAVTADVAHWVGARLGTPGDDFETHGRELKRGSKWPRAAWNVGSGRFAADISMWPAAIPIPPLAEFLQFPTVPLSPKATAGFLSRATKSSLRFPPGFLEAVAAHLEAVSNGESAKILAS